MATSKQIRQLNVLTTHDAAAYFLVQNSTSGFDTHAILSENLFTRALFNGIGTIGGSASGLAHQLRVKYNATEYLDLVVNSHGTSKFISTNNAARSGFVFSPVDSGGNTANFFRVTQHDDSSAFEVDAANKRVGIGKASPATALDVVGDITASAGVVVGDSTLTGNGTIRYNTGDIQGRIGGAWVSLATPPDASLTVKGIVELATTSETTTGTDAVRAVTPAGVQAAIDALVDSAPGALNTLNELAAAIGDDASYASTITTALGLKAPLASPTFTGTIAIPNIADLESAVAANTAKVTNVSTNLSATATNSSLTVESSDGDNVALPVASASAWGVMSDEQAAKLAGIEASADVTDATNVTAAGALMDSELADADAVKATTGTFLTADQTKLDGIEAGATADQTSSEIAAAVEAATDSNTFTDADHSKLNGIATNANNYTLPAASTTVVGGVELATNAETTTGTDTTRAVTPAGAKVELDKKAPLASPTFTGTVAIPNIANLETAVTANTAKVTNVTTNLGITTSETTAIITSSDGDDATIPVATTSVGGVMSKAIFDQHTANVAKATNVSTDLSTGTVNATSYGITSDGGTDDVVIAQADTNNAGVLSAAKWDEIVANTAKVTNVSTDLSSTANGTSLTVNSSDGNNASLPAATTTAWGVMSDDQATKLDGIEASATADQTAGEILTLVEDGIDSAHIKTDAIVAAKIADDAVQAAHIDEEQIFGSHIYPEAIYEPHLNITNAGASGLDGYLLSYNHNAVTPAQSNFTWVAATSADIDSYDAGTTLHQTQDHFLFSDNGTEKKITFSDLEDAIFGNVSSHITIAAGGAATLAANSVGVDQYVDDSILEAHLDCTNSAASGQVLSYDGSSGFTWVSVATGTNEWTDNDGHISPSAGTTEKVTLGTTTVLDNSTLTVLAPNDADDGAFWFESTNDAATTLVGSFSGPNRGTAASDDAAYLDFWLDNDTEAKHAASRLYWQFSDATNNDEDGAFIFATMCKGDMRNNLHVAGNGDNYFRNSSSTSSSVTDGTLTLWNDGNNVNPANGFGQHLAFRTKTSGAAGPGNEEIGTTLASVIEDKTGGSEDFKFVVNLMEGGNTAAERFSVSSAGVVSAHYGFNGGYITLDPWGTGTGETGSVFFRELATNGTNYVTMRAPDVLAATYALTLPADDGDSGEFLQTNGSGALSWSTVDINGSTDLAAPAVGDELLISDTSATNAVKKADVASIVNLADHDALTNFVANEHIDWTADSAGTIHASNYTDTNTMGSGFTVSATTNTTATTITQGETLLFAQGTGITTETTADGTVTIGCTVTDTTYTKASFDLDHLFTLVGAAADTSEDLGTFTGSTISDSVTIKAALQALETAFEATVTVAQGGTGITAMADKAVLITQDTGTDLVSAVAMSTNGQLLIGGTSGPAVSTLTAGTNITITNTDGGIEIAETSAPAVSAVTNGSDNRVATFTSTDALNGEANLTFDGTTLHVQNSSSNTAQVKIGKGEAVDAKVQFDGNAEDFYIGVDDTDDDLKIGYGSGMGTTSMINIGQVGSTGRYDVRFGVDDTGYDVTFYGASSGSYMRWDESANGLRLVAADYVQEQMPPLNVGASSGSGNAMAAAMLVENDPAGASGVHDVIVIDWSLGNYAWVTLEDNVIRMCFKNMKRGGRYILRLEQPSGANYTVSWADITEAADGTETETLEDYTKVRWIGGTPPTMTASNGKTDVYGFLCTRSNGLQMDCFVIAQNLSADAHHS